jgi:hypothetical protein
MSPDDASSDLASCRSELLSSKSFVRRESLMPLLLKPLRGFGVFEVDLEVRSEPVMNLRKMGRVIGRHANPSFSFGIRDFGMG